VALGYWGFKTGANMAVKVILGLGAPVLAVVIWGLFVSPKAKYGSPFRQAVLEALVFGAAVLALVASEHAVLAIALGVVALVDSLLVRLI
jgi:Protein of unknown function (DUF2568)